MNRYVNAAWGYVAFTLVLIGIAGISWEAFRPEGWVERSLGAVWDAQLRNPLLVAPMIVAVLFLTPRLFRGNLAIGKKKTGADVFVYFMMLAGLYFSFKWWIQ